jgi:tetratricopeptide (TPR) repeat protein
MPEAMTISRRVIRIFTGSVSALLLLAMVPGCRSGSAVMGSSGIDSRGDSITSSMLVVSAIYIDASKEKILGNFSRSIALLEQCLKQDPVHHPSYFQLADIHHIGGEYTSALYYIERALSLESGIVWYHVLYGDLLLKAGRYREAEDVYREVIRRQPGQRLWHEALAFSQRMAGKEMAAADTYRYILDAFGYDEEIFLKMLDVYEKGGRLRKVEQSLQWLIRSYPYETRYLGALAAFYYHRGKASKALPLWHEILRLEPQNGEVRFDLANYYRSRGEDEKAYRELYEAFSTPNLSIDAKIVVMQSYYQVTERYRELLPEAYILLGIMTDRHPENPKGWAMYGDFLFRDGMFAEALAMMQRVVLLDSTRYMVWEQLLRCAWLVSDFGVLRSQGERALNIFPDHALLYLFHGMGQLYGNDPDKALVTFEQGRFFQIMGDTIEADFLHGMARAYEISGKPERAGEFYRQALRSEGISYTMLAEQFRYAVLWSDGEHLELVRRRASVMLGRTASLPPMWRICEIWGLVRQDSVTAVARLQKLLEEYPAHYHVMEHASDIFGHLGMEAKASHATETAMRLSNGNMLLQ